MRMCDVRALAGTQIHTNLLHIYTHSLARTTFLFCHHRSHTRNTGRLAGWFGFHIVAAKPNRADQHESDNGKHAHICRRVSLYLFHQPRARNLNRTYSSRLSIVVSFRARALVFVCVYIFIYTDLNCDARYKLAREFNETRRISARAPAIIDWRCVFLLCTYDDDHHLRKIK